MNETNEQWAAKIAEELVSNAGVLSRELEVGFTSLALQRAIFRGYAQGAEFAVKCMKSSDRPSSADDVYDSEIEGAMP